LEVILDTNALSAAAEAEPSVAAWLEDAQQIAIPVVVLGEYLFGIAQSRRRTEHEQWLRVALENCVILNINDKTASKYAEVRLELKRAGTPIPPNDTWIAALCRQYALPLLSRDEHFDLVNGIQRLSW
jgi:predicted nucleic acid-binding protein